MMMTNLSLLRAPNSTRTATSFSGSTTAPSRRLRRSMPLPIIYSAMWVARCPLKWRSPRFCGSRVTCQRSSLTVANSTT
ncbi:ribitol kinase [Histoplasma capsulatum G186AR]|uniref:Ribitol kinase n=1 Tax=Ajellomyces capsulatus TaxID=5037 RepID=A0A8H8CZ35_AJECA|nr:ribitol kinase [Histoplasma capsulatum]QSS73767.1 ribitol kinase [Histoplasma capsulatum G186AR]